MNNLIIKEVLLKFLAAVIFIVSITSCNKDLDEVVPNPNPEPGTGGSSQTLAEFFCNRYQLQFL